MFIQKVFPFTNLTGPYKNIIHNQALVDSMLYTQMRSTLQTTAILLLGKIINNMVTVGLSA